MGPLTGQPSISHVSLLSGAGVHHLLPSKPRSGDRKFE